MGNMEEGDCEFSHLGKVTVLREGSREKDSHLLLL